MSQCAPGQDACGVLPFLVSGLQVLVTARAWHVLPTAFRPQPHALPGAPVPGLQLQWPWKVRRGLGLGCSASPQEA